MHTETAVHSGRDSLGNLLTPGRYVVSREGRREFVLVSEDADTGDLAVSFDGRMFLISEVEPSTVFSRVDSLELEPSGQLIEIVESHLARARAWREELARIEVLLAGELGCVRGDGTPLSDGITAAVRDGLGTAVDLLEISGDCRR